MPLLDPLNGRRSLFTAALIACSLIVSVKTLAAQPTVQENVPEVLLRLDDIGMEHSVNAALEDVARTGMRLSVSVMFVAPWQEEAVAILKRNPQITVGVHLALNSEWTNYRWGPVLGKAGVPTLVDEAGYFLPSTEEVMKRKPDLGEVERELNAQMDRAMASGLKIAYIDHHMGTAVATPELREVLERVAKRYQVGISRYFGESYRTMFDTPVGRKKPDLLAHLRSVKPGKINLVVLHVAHRTPQMDRLFDRNNPAQNAGGVPMMPRHRQAELNALLSPEVAALVKSGKVRLINYGQLIEREGLDAMRRPQ